MLGIPYTHSGALTEAITLDKTLTKQVLIHSNIPTPRYQLFRTGKELINPDLKYPLLVKPNSEGSSKGIFNENLVMDPVKLFERIEFVISQFKQEALVEEFIDGREFTVAILGNPPKVLPIVEQNYTIFPENMPHLASYEAKWLFEDQLPNPHDSYFCPAKLDANTEKLITNTCIRIWEALDIKDVARIDLRLDRNGIPNVLEVNTMPGLIPDQNVVSYFPVAARKSGLNYEEMVNTILDSAVKRYGLKQVQKSSLIREYAVVEKNSKS
ncbi:MAG: D-alanine-D-alanine ligase [Candidatus Gottesmanbacteria bacterium GW2011_GWC2_39_8]|uniref:D-alanine-D-alanine ligase n=1 Tax=Candidatus Gottesmanbacteria bacterium GW2011_GWC2_39_8 TaxID=1618450 RepID=A0A0G0SA75_9BACT|nr:MAG: D-alanine-D-alanine ligase [Candidatus Gottesmanbacteria bacterium GW2011_GWC2_39_8]